AQGAFKQTGRGRPRPYAFRVFADFLPLPARDERGEGSGSTAVELRSADFSPPPLGTCKSAGSGMNSALQVRRNWLNSTASGVGRGAMPFLMSFALEHEIVTLAWIDNASVQFPLKNYATKG